MLAEQTLQEEIRKKFFITLVVGDDDYYYIIALMVAYLYHENKSENGCSADELLELAEGYSIKKILTLGKRAAGCVDGRNARVICPAEYQ